MSFVELAIVVAYFTSVSIIGYLCRCAINPMMPALFPGMFAAITSWHAHSMWSTGDPRAFVALSLTIFAIGFAMAPL